MCFESAWGLCPTGPPFCPPPWAKGLPAFWVPLVAGLLMWRACPLLRFCGGTPPTSPAMGASPPWTPSLPTLVGLGFAGVLGPTRGGFAKVGNSPPLFVFGGTSPRPPARGQSPLDPQFARPRWLRVCQGFGSHSWRVNLSPGPSPRRGGEKFPPSLAGKGVRGLGRKGLRSLHPQFNECA